jgi:hypothetical protein
MALLMMCKLRSAGRAVRFSSREAGDSSTADDLRRWQRSALTLVQPALLGLNSRKAGSNSTLQRILLKGAWLAVA